MWGLFACVFPQVKFPDLADNATESKTYQYLRETRMEDAQTWEVKLQCIAEARQSILQKHMAKKYRRI